MESKTTTLIEALRALARTAETDDGVVESALNEAAGRMQEMRDYIAKEQPHWDQVEQWRRLAS